MTKTRRIHRVHIRTFSAIAIGVVIITAILNLAGVFKTDQIPPENVQISNQTDDSLTVSWTTSQGVKNSCIILSAKTQPLIRKLHLCLARWLPDVLTNSKTCLKNSKLLNQHHLSLSKLKPETEYSYQIISNHQLYDQQLFTLQTDIYTQPTQSKEPLPTMKTLPESNRQSSSPIPLYGSVLDTSGNPISNQIVYLSSLKAGGKLSALTDSTGAYYFDLTKLYDKNFNQLQLQSLTLIEIQANDQILKITTNQANPTPNLYLK